MGETIKFKNKNHTVTENALLKIPEKYLILLILLLSFFFFSNTARFDFIYNWDDNVNVTENAYIKDFSWSGIKTIFSKETKIEEPRLTLFTFSVQYYFWKLNPVPYHIANIMLHLLNVLLVFFFISKLTGKRNISFITAALFALHPMRVESVAWITGRKDLLYAAFFLISLLFYLQYLKDNQKIKYLFLVFIAGYLSMLSKIQAVVLPGILFLIDYYFSRKITSRMALEKVLLALLLLNLIPFKIFILFLVLLIFLALHEKNIFKKIPLKTGLPVLVVIAFVCIIQIFLFSTFILALYLLFLVWFLLEKLNCKKYIEKASLYFILKKYKTSILTGIICIITVVSLYFLSHKLQFWNTQISKNFTMAERFCMACYALDFYILKFFLPLQLSAIYPYPERISGSLPPVYYFSIFIFPLIAGLITWGLAKIKENRRELIFGLFFFMVNISLFLHIIPILGRVITADHYTYIAYLGLFFSIGVISNKILTRFPDFKLKFYLLFVIILVTLGMITLNRNKVWKNETDLYTDLIEKQPDFATAYTNRGTIFYKNNKLREAMNDYNKAIETDSTFSLAYYDRALAYVSMQKFDLAIMDCNKAIRYDSTFFNCYYLMGYSKNQTGDFTGAVSDFNIALKIDSTSYLSYFNRGVAKKSLQDYPGALKDYTQAIQIKPDFAEAYNNRGIIKYFTEDYAGSIDDYNHAIRLNNKNSNPVFNRALSELKLNEKDKACEDLNTAKALGHKDAERYILENCK